MTKLSSGCCVEPRLAVIALRSFSMAVSVLELEALMTIDSFPLASRIFTESAPRLTGSSDISNSFTACGAKALELGDAGAAGFGELSELASSATKSAS